MYARAMTWRDQTAFLWHAPRLLLRPLQLALNFPAPLFLATLLVLLFRPCDLDLHNIDRIAFCLLCVFVSLRALALRQRLPFIARLSLPMLALIALAVLRVARAPFDVRIWSMVAGKFIVPFVLFHLAMLVFRGRAEQRQFELFVVVTLAYLTFTAVAFLVDARALVFPRFILDESVGIHVDRARGPFLQAVANGLSLNLLGLLAFTVSGNVKRRMVWVLWSALPWAILATMTRSVWIGFAASTIAVAIRLSKWPVGKTCFMISLASLIVLATGLSTFSLRHAIFERTEERGPVQARMAVYEAGWSMIRERPLTGWPATSMYRELARRMPGYRLNEFYVHNTYLSLLLEFGWPGLALYGFIFFHLFRLSKLPISPESYFVSRLRSMWPLLLCVFLFNAFFVDMVYQFVIGLLFTVAGILCSSPEAA